MFTLKLQTIQTFKIQLKMKCVDLIGEIDFDLLIDYWIFWTLLQQMWAESVRDTWHFSNDFRKFSIPKSSNNDDITNIDEIIRNPLKVNRSNLGHFNFNTVIIVQHLKWINVVHFKILRNFRYRLLLLLYKDNNNNRILINLQLSYLFFSFFSANYQIFCCFLIFGSEKLMCLVSVKKIPLSFTCSGKFAAWW